MNPYRVAVIDDHAVVVEGVKTLLSGLPEYQIVYAGQKGKELLAQAEVLQPDLLLMDIQMPEINGIELCRQVVKLCPITKIIAFSSFDDPNYVMEIFRCGAKGYVLKTSDRHTILHAIKEVMKGEEYIDDIVTKKLWRANISRPRRKATEVHLTQRETEILKLIAEGLSSPDISEKLSIALRTVEAHRLNLNHKLDVKNTAGLVREAVRRGLF